MKQPHIDCPTRVTALDFHSCLVCAAYTILGNDRADLDSLHEIFKDRHLPFLQPWFKMGFQPFNSLMPQMNLLYDRDRNVLLVRQTLLCANV